MPRPEYVPGEISLKLKSIEDKNSLLNKLQRMSSVVSIEQTFPESDSWLGTLYIINVNPPNTLRVVKILQRCQFVEYATGINKRWLVLSAT